MARLITLLKKYRKFGLYILFIILSLPIFRFLILTDFEKGNIFFSKNHLLYNINLAQYFYKRELVADSKNSKVPPLYTNYQLGRTYFIKGDLYLALESFKAEELLYPENIRVHYMRGLTYGYLDMEELAIEEFEKFIQAKPDTWAGRNDKAWLEFRIGKIDDALNTIEPVANQIDNAWVQNTYGVLLMNKKKYKDAKVAFEYAKIAADTMTETQWGNTYPGNDPRVYATGLKGMRLSIDNNLELLATKK